MALNYYINLQAKAKRIKLLTITNIPRLKKDSRLSYRRLQHQHNQYFKIFTYINNLTLLLKAMQVYPNCTNSQVRRSVSTLEVQQRIKAPQM